MIGVFFLFLKFVLLIDYNMTKFNKNRQPILNSAIESIKASKAKLFIISIITLIALITGIIVGAKTDCFDECITFASFWARFFSMILIMLICFGCAFTKWLCPLAGLFLAYRAYLLGLQIVLIILNQGFVGGILALLIVFPCQIIVLFSLICFYILMSKLHNTCYCFGFKNYKGQILGLLLVETAILLLCCVLQALLFFLLGPNSILII